MAFSLTTQQIKDKTKTVTRRIGWKDLKPGDRVFAIEKGQGLKKGEKVNRLCLIECVSNQFQELAWILDEPYGTSECAKEGFPNLTPREFVDMFCKANQCEPRQPVNRIEFKYVETQLTETRELDSIAIDVQRNSDTPVDCAPGLPQGGAES